MATLDKNNVSVEIAGVAFTPDELFLAVYLVSLVNEEFIPPSRHDYLVVYHKCIMATENVERQQKNRDL